MELISFIKKKSGRNACNMAIDNGNDNGNDNDNEIDSEKT